MVSSANVREVVSGVGKTRWELGGGGSMGALPWPGSGPKKRA